MLSVASPITFSRILVRILASGLRNSLTLPEYHKTLVLKRPIGLNLVTAVISKLNNKDLEGPYDSQASPYTSWIGTLPNTLSAISQQADSGIATRNVHWTLLTSTYSPSFPCNHLTADGVGSSHGPRPLGEVTYSSCMKYFIPL